MIQGERQVQTDVRLIRADHVNRYTWAAEWIRDNLQPGARILDCACGVGYGSKILADAGSSVVGIDNCDEAIQFAQTHYSSPSVTYLCEDANNLPELGVFDAVVCFETLEHLSKPQSMLDSFMAASDVLLISAPNEDVIHYGPGWTHHYRHYTTCELCEELKPYTITWYGKQDTRHAAVEAGLKGRTMVVAATLS